MFYLREHGQLWVVLLLSVASLVAGETTGVPMSSGYGGYQTATPAFNYTTTYATTGYYTTKAPEHCNTTCDVPYYYTEASKYNSAPSTTPRRERSTTPRRERSTTPRRERSTTPRRERSTTPRRERSTTPRFMLPFYTEAPKYYTKEVAYYATTRAALSYYTEGPKYYTTKAPEYYTTDYTSRFYYKEIRKC